MMGLELRASTGESEASLARRARVLAFRIARGEYVKVPAYDPVSDVLFELLKRPVPWAVPAGNAIGAVPEAL